MRTIVPLIYRRPVMHVVRLLMRVSCMFDLTYRRNAQHRPRELTPSTYTTFFKVAADLVSVKIQSFKMIKIVQKILNFK
jgi:hypothetical protein